MVDLNHLLVRLDRAAKSGLSHAVTLSAAEAAFLSQIVTSADADPAMQSGTCPACSGHGMDVHGTNDNMSPCATCGGSGRYDA